jgi:hypothetical protein
MTKGAGPERTEGAMIGRADSREVGISNVQEACDLCGRRKGKEFGRVLMVARWNNDWRAWSVLAAVEGNSGTVERCLGFSHYLLKAGNVGGCKCTVQYVPFVVSGTQEGPPPRRGKLWGGMGHRWAGSWAE